MRDQLKQFCSSLRRAAGRVDARDICAFGGLALVGYGVGLIHLPAAFIVCGAALFWIGAAR